MKSIKRIVCPVDFSTNSQEAIRLASQLAELNRARLVFVYVAPQWLTNRDIAESEFVHDAIESDRKQLDQIKPTNSAIDYEHQFLFGNPGPEIVRAAKNADLIVLSTHGYSGLKRFLVGSVAQYVMRYAECPVISYKGAEVKSGSGLSKKVEEDSRHVRQRFITDVMRHVTPIGAASSMTEVVAELESAHQTAAPVCDSQGVCVGILTATDIQSFKKAGKKGFVQEYYSSPVVTIMEDSSCQHAHQIFLENAKIHHLVVVNPQNQPLGVVESNDIYVCSDENDDGLDSPSP